jgi:hypothetical protein
MMADARCGRFDVLVCEAIDRLGRNLSDVSAAFDELVFARIAVPIFLIASVKVVQMLARVEAAMSGPG